MLLAATLAVAGCAGAPPRASSATSAPHATANAVRSIEGTAPVGELPAAVPTGGEATDHAQTGSVARVVLGARRERVAELYQQYVRALASRDLDALRLLFDDPVLDIEGGDSRTRESMLRHLEAFVNQNDPAQFVQALNATRPAVRSVADLRRLGRSLPAAMRADDWLVEGPGRQFAAMPMSIPLPRALLVRWVGDAPLIVGVSLPRQPR